MGVTSSSCIRVCNPRTSMWKEVLCVQIFFRGDPWASKKAQHESVSIPSYSFSFEDQVFSFLPPSNNCFLQFLVESCNRYPKGKDDGTVFARDGVKMFQIKIWRKKEEQNGVARKIKQNWSSDINVLSHHFSLKKKRYRHIWVVVLFSPKRCLQLTKPNNYWK